MISCRRKLSVVLPVAAVMVLALTSDTFGQVRPFRIKGQGTILDPIPLFPGTSRHVIKGNATYLGRHEGAGVAEIIAVNPQTLTGTFKSNVPFVFVAANGDKLAFHYGNRDETDAKEDGQVTAIPGNDGRIKTVWVAEFIPVPEESTGRFKRVCDGSFIMIAETEPFIPLLPGTEEIADRNVKYKWSGSGWIAFARPGRR